MKKEFTTYITPIETIFVLETATGGASSTAGGVTLSQPLGTVQTRTTDEEADKVPQKPRQGPLRQQTGGGKHRDKRKEQKQGQEKHRKPFMENEIESTTLENDWKHGRRYHQVYGDPGENTKDEIYLVKKHYFKVPFDKKDGAKQIGLRWDPDVKTWYLPEYSVAGKRFESRLMAAKSVFGDEIKVASEEGVAEGSLDPDHEISMASNQLLSIIEDAMRLLKIVRKYSEAEGLEAWQQSKLTKAADYLEAVLNNLQGDQVFQKEDHSNYGNGWGQESYNTYASSNHGRGVAEGFPHDVDHMPGKTVKHTSSNCTTCHGRKTMYKLDGKLFADNKKGATPVKCPTCKGTGDKKGVAEGLAPGQAAWKQEMIAKGAVKFQRDQHGGGAVDRIVAYDKDGKVVGGFNRKGVAEGDFDKWGSEIKTPNPDRKQFKQPTSPAKLARQQAADRQRKKSAKESEMAEDFTDDVDNIYAMHPQPEKSEKIAFLILDKDEIEFATDWRKLSDPYQQEFGYDLPLWDADDFGSYPNLVVKPITFDQYVNLVGNYIESEELAGSTMSKMKRGAAEEETNESGLLAWAGRRKHGADYMKKASAAARKGASQEELGRLKDRYSKAAKKEDSYTENLHNQLENFLKEKAPEGAKYKRMAKHIKASYKSSGLDKDEIAQRAFGATWKAAKKAKK